MRNCRQVWAYPLRIAKHSPTLRGLKVGECFAILARRGTELANVSQKFSFKTNFVENWSDVSHGIQISNRWSIHQLFAFCAPGAPLRGGKGSVLEKERACVEEKPLEEVSASICHQWAMKMMLEKNP